MRGILPELTYFAKYLHDLYIKYHFVTMVLFVSRSWKYSDV